MEKSNELSSTDPLEEIAKESAGNWMRFDAFGWHDKPDSPEDWTIVYTSNRDSRLLEKSNEAQIEKLLAPYLDPEDEETPVDVYSEVHNHWAVGYVNGYSIRVFRDNKITPAFRAWRGISDRLENYSILNEEDYSQRELDATVENIEQSARSYGKEYWPNDWISQLYDWFGNNDSSAIENTDDQGGYPSDNQLESAITQLGFPVDD